jgi:hypothetical protein
MNVARKLIFIAIGCFSSIGAEAQGINCTTATKLACLVPFRTGANVSGATAQANIFSGAIGSQLSQLPLAASAPGAIILTVKGNPEPYYNLGPVLVDRPDSVGQGKFVLGFSAQQFTFNRLDGNRIGAIPFIYSTTTSQYYAQTIDASVRYNQYVMLATYGFAGKTDVSVIVPYTRISMGVAAQNPINYSLNGVSGVSSFSPPGGGGYTSGSARGLGDIVVNIKHVLWSGGEAGRGSLAIGAAQRFPTGDALNYLGSGAYGFNLYGLAAYKAKFSPHIKIGYQWNTDSVLLNISGTPGKNQSLPGGFQTAVGVDYGVTRHLTLSADLLTNEFQNSPSVSQGFFINTLSGAGLPNATAPAAGTPCTALSNTATNTQQLGSLCTVNTVNNTFTEINFSGGFKLKPFTHQDLILYGNVLIQTTDVGLRSGASPSVGVSYNFTADKWPNWLYRKPGHW